MRVNLINPSGDFYKDSLPVPVKIMSGGLTILSAYVLGETEVKNDIGSDDFSV